MKPIELTKQQAKKLIQYACISIIIIIIILLVNLFLRMTEDNTDYNLHGKLLLPDLTGMEEEDAEILLSDTGFKNVSVEYIYDQFTNDNCVIRTNYHIRSILDEDAPVVIYVCDESIVFGEKKPEDTIADMPYDSLNQIQIIDLKVKEGMFYAIIQNNNPEAISGISFKMGYRNGNGSQIGSSEHELEDVVLMPGEKYMLSGEIKKPEAATVFFHSFTYNSKEIPENER